MSDPEPVLAMRGVSKRFGATRALHQVSLSVRRGEAMALIGENGAGKSTLMKILSGAITADEGSMVIDGAPYQPSGPLDARKHGVAMIYQELNLAPDLSVEDNIMLGQECRRCGLLDRKQQRQKVHDALAILGHDELEPATDVHQLSIGAQQLVEIARALASDAKVIVFDEPTSSLTQADARRLFEVIQKLTASDISVVYISHFLEEIRKVCDRYTVLRDGEMVGTGEIEGTSEAEVVSLMVGREVDELFPTVPHEPSDVLLEITGLSGETYPQEIDLQLRRGEILGIAGLVGAGRTELLRSLFGLDAVQSGTVTVAGRPMKQSPHASIRSGIGLVSEDRKTEGLAQDQSIADNMTLSRLEAYSRFGVINLRRRRDAVSEQMKRMHVKARDGEQPVSDLSGGNQQKVAIARVLHQEADVLLLDEPTRGIDVGTKSEIYRLIGELAAQGKAVLFVSSYLPELMAVCDRIAVMSRGRIQEVRDVTDWTEEEVMSVAIRTDEQP